MAEPARALSSDVFTFGVHELTAALGFDVMRRASAMAAFAPARRVEVSGDGTRLTCIVASERSRSQYHQTIMLSRVGATLKIKGYCTCPVGQNCKHIGVALLTHLGAQGASLPENAKPSVDFEDELSMFPPGVRNLLQYQLLQSVAKTLPQAVAPAAPALPKGPQLSNAAQGWLQRINAIPATIDVAPTLSKAPTRTLFYVIAPSRGSANEGVWAIRPVSVGRDRNGEPQFSDQRDVSVDQADRLKSQGVKYLTTADFDILQDLQWLQHKSKPYSEAQLKPSRVARTTLDAIIATGRARFNTADGIALEAGPTVAAAPAWQRKPDTTQQMRFAPVDGGVAFDAVIPTEPLRYIRGNQIGAIETTLPPALALEVARAPAIRLIEATAVKEALARYTAPAPAPQESFNAETGEVTSSTALVPWLPLPDAVTNVVSKRIAPKIRLRLFMGDVRLKDRFRWSAPADLQGTFKTPLVQLSFEYGGEWLPHGDPRQSIEKLSDDGELLILQRDPVTEDGAIHRLRSMRFLHATQSVFDAQILPDGVFWLRPRGDADAYDMLDELDHPERFVTFSANDVPRLEKAGWQVVFDDSYPYRIATGDAEWWADVGAGSGIDWFSFELGITYEGQRINIIPQLASLIGKLPPSVIALAQKPGADKDFAKALGRMDLFVSLPDKRMLRVPADRVGPMIKGILELVGPRGDRIVDGKVKLHRAEAATLANFADLTKMTWAASAQKLIDLGQSLRRGKSMVPVAPPETFKASLRPYQADGLAWLDFLRDAGFGGVLADDMGLGKTVQGLAFLAREKAEGRLTKPALILAPTSVMPNWQAEAERFAPHLKVLALRGLDRKQLFPEIPTADLVLTTYPLLARDKDVLLEQEFHIALLDEAQAIKNPKANISAIAHRINARHRFALTGTPLENNLGEVWSLFEFLSPGLLGDESNFKRTFRTPIEKHGDPVAQGFLSRRLKPFMLRRTKAEVAKELPPKTEIIERIQLEGPQRDLYETVRALMEKKVRAEIDRKGLAKSHIIFLDALLKLRQICCDPRLLKMDAAKKVKQSAKLDRLMELIPEMVAEGRKILLFSQFTSMLDLIATELKREKIPFVTLRGDTSDRAVPVREFQTGKVPVFLLSLKAGGTGLNLTAADTVIHYDPWWNPAVENQATDRAYRIGQDKPVFVHKLIVEEGIEDAIELLKKKKAALAAALFAGSADAPMKLTENDIAALFAPIGSTRAKSKA